MTTELSSLSPPMRDALDYLRRCGSASAKSIRANGWKLHTMEALERRGLVEHTTVPTRGIPFNYVVWSITPHAEALLDDHARGVAIPLKSGLTTADG